MASRKYVAGVFEVSSRVSINNATDEVVEVVEGLAGHQSEKNTSAHQISNISGLQTALNGKQDVISGYTGNVSVVVGVDFTAQTITTVEIKIVNGIITEIN